MYRTERQQVSRESRASAFRRIIDYGGIRSNRAAAQPALVLRSFVCVRTGRPPSPDVAPVCW